MPMIDVYATAGTFTDKHKLAANLAATLMAIEGVPVHEHGRGCRW